MSETLEFKDDNTYGHIMDYDIVRKANKVSIGTLEKERGRWLFEAGYNGPKITRSELKQIVRFMKSLEEPTVPHWAGERPIVNNITYSIQGQTITSSELKQIFKCMETLDDPEWHSPDEKPMRSKNFYDCSVDVIAEIGGEDVPIFWRYDDDRWLFGLIPTRWRYLRPGERQGRDWEPAEAEK